MLANGRDGKRSGVSPFFSLVVSQKNWKVRRSMSRNRGGSSGGPAGFSASGAGGSGATCSIGPGFGGATSGSDDGLPQPSKARRRTADAVARIACREFLESISTPCN